MGAAAGPPRQRRRRRRRQPAPRRLRPAYTDTLDWTPDGATLLCDGDGLLSVQADGTGLTRLVEDAGTPASSPSGSHVLFVGSPDGEDRGLWCYEVATAASRLVIPGFTFAPDLAWQPQPDAR